MPTTLRKSPQLATHQSAFHIADNPFFYTALHYSENYA